MKKFMSNNLSNCWELSLRQSAAKPLEIKERSTTIERHESEPSRVHPSGWKWEAPDHLG